MATLGTKVCHFLQGMKSIELEAMVNVIQAKWQKFNTDFDATMPSGHEERLYNVICPYCQNWESASEALSGSLNGENRMQVVSQGKM